MLVFSVMVFGLSAGSGCGGRDASPAKDSGADNLRGAAFSGDSVFSLRGLWVNKAYADTLLLTHSPRASQKVGGETCLYFTDSAEPSVMVPLGWHEGTAWSIMRDSAKVILYDSGVKRNMGVVERISPKEIRLGHEYFVKLEHSNQNSYDYNVVEDLLFAGDYQTESRSTVSLSPDGLANGWDTIRYFEPYVDYIGPGMDVDQIGLGANKDKLTSYGFKFDKDTLFIYKLKCLLGYDSTDNSCAVVDYGELRWKMIKKH